jgi:thioredoxin-like negative regulator of GroEL
MAMSHGVSNFQTEVIKRSFCIPVLVDFWAQWSGPRKILGPVLERLGKQNEGQWVLAKLNTEEHIEVARKACIAVFRLLGEEHMLTQQCGREFSSALY